MGRDVLRTRVAADPGARGPGVSGLGVSDLAGRVDLRRAWGTVAVCPARALARAADGAVGTQAVAVAALAAAVAEPARSVMTT